LTKVFIDPVYSRPDRCDGGIRRVVEAQNLYLSKYGVKIVGNPKDADVIANHGSALTEVPGIPMVSVNHGLYWSRFAWGDVYHEVNQQVVENMRRAVAHTAPSHWVAVSLRRGMLVYPEVVYHGVDADEWKVSPDYEQFVLWNKARADQVSNPDDMNRVAAQLTKRRFITTVGEQTDNVHVLGKMNFPDMKRLIGRAGVYLATARETFGIGTLEAMAAGVPVAGWDWGGQSEIVKKGETGYLARPGDFPALADCIEKCFAERERLSANARADVVERWGWPHRIEQYARIFKQVHERYSRPRPKVSVVVTCYNLAHYLDDCLKSVAEQSMEDFECLIVDDHSEDNTRALAVKWESRDTRFKYRPTPKNMGLSGARMYGIRLANGEYIQPLDADDMLDEHSLAITSEALDKDPGIHIAYGHLDLVNEKGENRRRNETRDNQGNLVSQWPFEQYSWRMQMNHLNCPHYASLVRREVFERSGGYRVRQWRAEDAEFWCRVTSLGFRARKVAKRSTLIYRQRGDSKSMQEGGDDGDWTSWFPWRTGASTRDQGKALWPKVSGGWLPAPNLVPFGATGTPPKGQKFWYVHDYSYPQVSVIIPVGPGHEEYLIDALDSLVAQTYPDWEAIVVNDTGKEWGEGLDSPVCGAPWARVVMTEDGPRGASHARNLGAKYALSGVLAFKDADDFWLPNFLERTMTYYEAYEGSGLIYTGWLRHTGGDADLEPYLPNEFVQGAVLEQMQHAGTSILTPRWVHEKIVEAQGGWDENMDSWEEWDYQIAAQAIAEACSYKVDEPLFVYRFYTGGRREVAQRMFDDDGEEIENPIRQHLLQYIHDKWRAYYDKEKRIMCGCKRRKRIPASPSTKLASSGNFQERRAAQQASQPTRAIKLEYHGNNDKVTIKGPATGETYRFGRKHHKVRYVYVEDAAEFLKIRSRGIGNLFSEYTEPTPAPVETEGVSEEGAKVPEFPKMTMGAEGG
jgi:glycosyltransferase involved in cell wall biosynthesis